MGITNYEERGSYDRIVLNGLHRPRTDNRVILCILAHYCEPIPIEIGNAFMRK